MNAGPQLVALADPTRRSIYNLVRDEPASVCALTDQLPISQPAVSQHLRVLRSARLVASTAKGASRIYSADAEGVAVLRAWVDDIWNDILVSNAEAVNRENEK